MTSTSTYIQSETLSAPAHSHESCASGINWAAILGGGLGAAAIALVLMTLGAALGLSALAPWSSNTFTSFTMKAATWLIFTQWIASGLGGYITGRLRPKWVSIHDDEVFFRDTAHGFLTWAFALVLTAIVFGAGVSSLISGGMKSSAAIAAGAEAGDAAHPNNRPPMNSPFDYYIDALYRPTPQTLSANAQTPPPPPPADQALPPNAPVPLIHAPVPNPQASRGEVTRILMQGLKNGSIPDADKTYMTQVITASTGLNDQDAAKRVDDTIAQLNTVTEQTKQDVEKARKAAMHVSLYLAFSMLIGAFIASVAGTLGGRLRDEYHAEYHATNLKP